MINTIPSSPISGFAPFKKLYGFVPDYFSFRVFGCTCFAPRPHVEHSKLPSRSAICVFICYGEGKKRYCCFDPITQKIYVFRHVVFLEHIPFFSIPSNTHSLTRSDLIYIDHFSKDYDGLSS
jgi:histone deacetylase 1/2